MKKLLLLFSLLSLSSIAQPPVGKNIQLAGTLTYPQGVVMSNIGGYVDSLGNEYALVGTSLGLSIVDVTNPSSPVEVASIPGPNSIWREVKTWQKFAYVTTEGGADGLQIVDLSHLPDASNVPYQTWQPFVAAGASGQTLETIHALHIEDGFVYLYGSNNGNTTGGPIDGIVIADLADPWNPSLAGLFDQYYIHDGYVRNDTVWGGAIYNGFFSVIDVTDKANPVVLQTQQTPSVFTHNTWLSDNSRYLFTTDEVADSYLGVYDVNDLSNITEMDRIQSQNPGSLSIVHNTHILNDYAVTSWYTDGVVITDGHRPGNLVNVGWYDTSPFNGDGFNGCWGVYPFLPSGNLVASDIEGGLYVLTPTYIRAAYLEGSVSDSICGDPLSGVTVTISGINVSDSTNTAGLFATGTPDAGSYTVTFSKPGYTTRVFSNVSLVNSQVTNLTVYLAPLNAVNLNGLVEDSLSASPLAQANVTISNASNSFNYVSDVNGAFSQCGLAGGIYDVVAGKWGYETFCDQVNISVSNISIDLKPGIYDDFSFPFGWTTSGNASTGIWLRAIPAGTDFNGTPSNPNSDDATDCSDKAYVTGNNSANASSDDVDNGSTTLNSPNFSLTGYTFPQIRYSRWFFNGGGSGNPNDSLIISLTNGTQTLVLETVTANSPSNSSWVSKAFDLFGAIPFTSNMQLRVRTADAAPGHLVEAGFDHFRIVEMDAVGMKAEQDATKISVSPVPSNPGEPIHFTASGGGIHQIQIYDLTGRLVVNHNGIPQSRVSIYQNLPAGSYLWRTTDSLGNHQQGKLMVR